MMRSGAWRAGGDQLVANRSLDHIPGDRTLAIPTRLLDLDQFPAANNLGFGQPIRPRPRLMALHERA